MQPWHPALQSTSSGLSAKAFGDKLASFIPHQDAVVHRNYTLFLHVCLVADTDDYRQQRTAVYLNLVPKVVEVPCSDEPIPPVVTGAYQHQHLAPLGLLRHSARHRQARQLHQLVHREPKRPHEVLVQRHSIGLLPALHTHKSLVSLGVRRHR